MDGYPNSDEEFELMYGDELDVLREQEEEELNFTAGPAVRRSLDFETPKGKEKAVAKSNPTLTKSDFISDPFSSPGPSKNHTSKSYIDPNTPSTSKGPTVLLNNSFDRDFSPIQTETYNYNYENRNSNGNLNGKAERNFNGNLNEKSNFNDSNLNEKARNFNESLNETNEKKRGITDLFGDIDDILDDDFLPASKKQKSKQRDIKEDYKLIERIVEMRQVNKNRFNLKTSNEFGVASNSETRLKHIKENLSFRIPRYPFIPVERHDGERVYVRIHSEDYEKAEIKRIASNTVSKGSLMGRSFSELVEKAKKYLETRSESLNSRQEIAQSEITQSENAQMWVDLYKPKKYLELLSDESTNRILLRWIKLWDKVVFKRRPKVLVNNKNKSQNNKFGNKFKKIELDETLDENDRPKNKIALLCGPPGLGKTTLAHMVARHAGYNVVEINASDDRNIDHFRTALESATQMKSVLDKEKRPNCLVFDEIDGAPTASIEFLIKFVNGTLKPKKAKKQGGGKSKTQLLNRPIICICNDVYVPALRPLRQIAFIINFPPTASSRLAERLCEIARYQNIKTDLGAMTTLSEKTDNDIRSCLSVLHFFKTQNKPVTLSEVHRQNIGNKDMNKGLFTVWTELFQTPRPKVDCRDNKNSLIKSVSECFRTDYVYALVQSFGDYERLGQGVFENYLEITKNHDIPISAAAEGLDWFCFTDFLNTKIQETQNWTLGAYIPYAFVKWNSLFAVQGKPKVNYPSQSSEVYAKSQRATAILSEILKGMLPSTRPFASKNSLRLEILPYLSEIIVPILRTSNITLFGSYEKEQLHNVVNIMIDYSLTYLQERTVDGTYVFNIDPNIDEIVNFETLKKQNPRRTLQYGVKQLVAREIELENMRRLDMSMKRGGLEERVEKSGGSGSGGGKEKDPEKKVEGIGMGDKGKENKDTNAPTPAPALPNHLQRLKAKNINVQKETVAKDFFGRVIQKTNSRFAQHSSSAPFQQVWYVYKEGYNNAVKRKLKMNQLL